MAGLAKGVVIAGFWVFLTKNRAVGRFTGTNKSSSRRVGSPDGAAAGPSQTGKDASRGAWKSNRMVGAVSGAGRTSNRVVEINRRVAEGRVPLEMVQIFLGQAVSSHGPDLSDRGSQANRSVGSGRTGRSGQPRVKPP